MAKLDENYFDIKEPMNQNEISDILGEGERVLLTLRPEKRVYIFESILKGLPFALLWGGFDAFFIIMMIAHGVFNESDTLYWFIPIFFLFHLIPVWSYIAIVIKRLAGYKNLSYVFTDKRIIKRSGVIGVDFDYIYYTDIETVQTKVGLLDKLFKVGDLHINGKSSSLNIDDIKNPYQYGNKIQDIVRDLKADMQFPNDLRPDENHGYNTKYTK